MSGGARDITSLPDAAAAAAEIAAEAQQLGILAEEIVTAASQQEMDVTDMVAGQEDLGSIAEIWSNASMRYRSAANAAEDTQQANDGNLAVNLGFAARESE